MAIFRLVKGSVNFWRIFQFEIESTALTGKRLVPVFFWEKSPVKLEIATNFRSMPFDGEQEALHRMGKIRVEEILEYKKFENALLKRILNVLLLESQQLIHKLGK